MGTYNLANAVAISLLVLLHWYLCSMLKYTWHEHSTQSLDVLLMKQTQTYKAEIHCILHTVRFTIYSEYSVWALRMCEVVIIITTMHTHLELSLCFMLCLLGSLSKLPLQRSYTFKHARTHRETGVCESCTRFVTFFIFNVNSALCW